MRLAFSLLAALPLLADSAFGWGCQGHQVVALIARAHLKPAAAAAVDQILRESPIDPRLSRFCRDRPDDPMADAATWADDQRTVEKATERYHFIDIPIAVHTASVPEQDATKWCPPAPNGDGGCIVSALQESWSTLRIAGIPASKRAEALRYLIHLIGDEAQPLHVSDNHDQGGNCTSIRFFAEEKPRTLHSIWDTQLIARDLESEKLTQPQYARKLDERFADHWRDWGEAKVDFLAWAWDSHRVADTMAYGDLSPRIPVEPAAAGEADKEACGIERDKVLSLHLAVGAPYEAQVIPAIREQLAKAGHRLAGLLNATFQ